MTKFQRISNLREYVVEGHCLVHYLVPHNIFECVIDNILLSPVGSVILIGVYTYTLSIKFSDQQTIVSYLIVSYTFNISLSLEILLYFSPRVRKVVTAYEGCQLRRRTAAKIMRT